MSLHTFHQCGEHGPEWTLRERSECCPAQQQLLPCFLLLKLRGTERKAHDNHPGQKGAGNGMPLPESKSKHYWDCWWKLWMRKECSTVNLGAGFGTAIRNPTFHVGVSGFMFQLCFSFQFPARGHSAWGQVTSQVAASLPSVLDTWRNFHLLASCWPKPDCCMHLKRETMDGRSGLSSNVSLSLKENEWMNEYF